MAQGVPQPQIVTVPKRRHTTTDRGWINPACSNWPSHTVLHFSHWATVFSGGGRGAGGGSCPRAPVRSTCAWLCLTSQERLFISGHWGRKTGCRIPRFTTKRQRTCNRQPCCATSEIQRHWSLTRHGTRASLISAPLRQPTSTSLSTGQFQPTVQQPHPLCRHGAGIHTYVRYTGRDFSVANANNGRQTKVFKHTWQFPLGRQSWDLQPRRMFGLTHHPHTADSVMLHEL